MEIIEKEMDQPEHWTNPTYLTDFIALIPNPKRSISDGGLERNALSPYLFIVPTNFYLIAIRVINEKRSKMVWLGHHISRDCYVKLLSSSVDFLNFRVRIQAKSNV